MTVMKTRASGLSSASLLFGEASVIERSTPNQLARMTILMLRDTK
jgi:hypothetical protein